MMFALLRQLRRLPITPPEVERFLFRAARLMVIGEITGDDWCYLTSLVAYKIRKQKGENI